MPLRFTTTGRRSSSRRYLTVLVDVDSLGFVDFLLEAGTYGALITPEFRERLGLTPSDGDAARAINSSGPTLRQRVQLPELWLGTQRLPPLRAYVSPLPVSGRRKDVAGLLGVKALRCFDLDIDVGGGQVAFHPAGHVEAGLCDVTGLARIPCRYTKAGLVCLPVSLGNSKRPSVLGILDLSAAVSVLNWEAAAQLGMVCEPSTTDAASSSGGEASDDADDGGRISASGEGCYGSIEIIPEEPLRSRPSHRAPDAAPSASGAAPPPQLRLPQSLARLRPGDGRPASGGGQPTRRIRLRRVKDGSSVRLQVQRVRASQLRLKLGDECLGGVAPVRAPPKLAVAHLRGLRQLGLQGHPAMVVGADVWGQRRAVLCLKSGWLYLTPLGGEAASADAP